MVQVCRLSLFRVLFYIFFRCFGCIGIFDIVAAAEAYFRGRILWPRLIFTGGLPHFYRVSNQLIGGDWAFHTWRRRGRPIVSISLERLRRYRRPISSRSRSDCFVAVAMSVPYSDSHRVVRRSFLVSFRFVSFAFVRRPATGGSASFLSLAGFRFVSFRFVVVSTLPSFLRNDTQ